MKTYSKNGSCGNQLIFTLTAIFFLGSLGCEEAALSSGATQPSKNTLVLSPPVPAALSDDPNDPDWVFEGYAKPLSEEEKLRRKQENDYIRTLTEEEYRVYKEERKQKRKEKKRKEAAKLGIPFDDRDDLYVALLPNNQVWRRKKPDNKSTVADSRKREQAAGIEVSENESAKEKLMWDETAENTVVWDKNGPGVRVDAYEDGEYCAFSDCTSREQSDVASADSLNTTDLLRDIAFDEDSTGGVDAPTLKAVFGTDTRSLISAYRGYSLTSYPWRTHGMFTNSSQSDSSLPIDLNCSGTKIGARVVVTAGHCLYDGGWTSGADRWYPGPDGINALMNGGDPSPNGYKGWTAHLVHPDWYDDSDYKDDMGWHILHDNQSSCNIGWLGFADESGLDGDTVNLYGVPGERQTCAASPQANDYCYASVYGTSGSVTRARVSSIRYKIDTSPGQSGSGVYKYYSSSGNRYVVAVHSGKWDSDENYACRMNDNKFDMTDGVVDDYPSSYCD